MSSKTLISDADVVVCCGSGGVGKTTTAAALGLQAARNGRRCVVVTIDPAKRLADALGCAGRLDQRSDSTRRSTGPAKLWALMLDTATTFDGLVEGQRAQRPSRRREFSTNSFYRNIAGSLGRHAGVHGGRTTARAAPRQALRPRDRRHASDAQRARLPRCAADAGPVPRPSACSS